jgi:hypothetical protein
MLQHCNRNSRKAEASAEADAQDSSYRKDHVFSFAHTDANREHDAKSDTYADDYDVYPHTYADANNHHFDTDAYANRDDVHADADSNADDYDVNADSNPDTDSNRDAAR